MPSTSKKQHNLMAAVAKNPAFAKKVGIKQSVGAEFMKADKGRKFKEGGAMDMAQDKKLVKKAIGMHDTQLHGGKKTNLTKLAKGGYCGGGKMKAKKYNTGGELPQDKTDRIAREENKADRELVTKPARAVVEGVKRMYNAATGKGAKDFEPKTFTKAMGGPDDSGWEKYSQYTATDAVTTPVGGADAEMRPLNMGKKSKAYKASDFKQGGKVRGCGCAVKGKTKGRMV